MNAPPYLFVIRRPQCAAIFLAASALPGSATYRELAGLRRGEAICGCQACAGAHPVGYRPPAPEGRP